ncbi:MAG TPA: hypothetical protein VGM90_16940 [Kofleriaceae bacterium]|jgi:hypothetical protein
MSRQRVQDSFDTVERRLRAREQLVSLQPGGARDRPIDVKSSAVIEPRVKSTPCHHCGGEYRVLEHEMAASGLRRVDAACRHCSAPRTLWFRLVPAELN